MLAARNVARWSEVCEAGEMGREALQRLWKIVPHWLLRTLILIGENE
jgi:hypothetical protein